MNKVGTIIQKVAIIRPNFEQNVSIPIQEMRKHIKDGRFILLPQSEEKEEIVVLNISDFYAYTLCKKRGYSYQVVSLNEGNCTLGEEGYHVKSDDIQFTIPSLLVRGIESNLENMIQARFIHDASSEIEFSMNVGMSPYIHRNAIYKGLLNQS